MLQNPASSVFLGFSKAYRRASRGSQRVLFFWFLSFFRRCAKSRSGWRLFEIPDSPAWIERHVLPGSQEWFGKPDRRLSGNRSHSGFLRRDEAPGFLRAPLGYVRLASTQSEGAYDTQRERAVVVTGNSFVLIGSCAILRLNQQTGNRSPGDASGPLLAAVVASIQCAV
jgi:hypothetical protein